MINKKVYTFLLVALLSFVSLSMFPVAGIGESATENAVEYVEQKNSIETEAKESSYLSFDLNFNVYEDKSYITYKDKIYTQQISNNLLRPPIFS